MIIALIILKIAMYMLVVATICTVFLNLRAMYIQSQLDDFCNKGYNLATFEPKNKMFWKFWVLRAKSFATEDTFLDRL